MTQQKDIIQSGNQIIRAYNDEGVKTPASGLQEWVTFLSVVDRLDLSWGEFNLATQGLPFPIKLERVIISFFSTPDATANINFSVNYKDLGIAILPVESGISRVGSITENVVITDEDTLWFRIDNSVNGTIDRIELQGYRVAQNKIQGIIDWAN